MFYDRFSELCKERSVSPSAVMVSIGLNKSNATFWKKGSIPKGETLQKLADYFGVSVDYLLEKTDFPRPDVTSKTERYEPWTQADEMILRAGGFRAVAEFNFLSDMDKAEALKDINKFIEFTLSKYKQQVSPEPGPPTPDTPLPSDAPEGPEAGE